MKYQKFFFIWLFSLLLAVSPFFITQAEESATKNALVEQSKKMVPTHCDKVSGSEYHQMIATGKEESILQMKAMHEKQMGEMFDAYTKTLQSGMKLKNTAQEAMSGQKKIDQQTEFIPFTQKLDTEMEKYSCALFTYQQNAFLTLSFAATNNNMTFLEATNKLNNIKIMVQNIMAQAQSSKDVTQDMLAKAKMFFGMHQTMQELIGKTKDFLKGFENFTKQILQLPSEFINSASDKPIQ